MQQAATLGIPLELEFQGRTWKIANPITFEIEAMFAQWVYAQAVDQIERLRALGEETGEGGLTEEQYQRAFDRLTDNMAAKKFAWGSEIVNQAATASWAGIKHLLYLRFKKCQHDASPQLIDAIFADPMASRRLKALLNPSVAAGEKKDGATSGDSASAPSAPAAGA